MDEWVDGALMRLVQSPANAKGKHLLRGKHVWAHRTTITCDLAHARNTQASTQASKHARMHKQTDEWMDDALAKVPHARIHTHERAQHGRTGGIRPMVRIQRRSGMKRYMMRANCSTTGSSHHCKTQFAIFSSDRRRHVASPCSSPEGGC